MAQRLSLASHRGGSRSFQVSRCGICGGQCHWDKLSSHDNNSKIIPNVLPKTNSFLMYTYRIRRVTGTVTDIAHYPHSQTKYKDPASYDYDVVSTALVHTATISAVLMTYK